ncbi:MAG: tetratricopeptide repeat protein [Planctomycetota bacterium]
MDQRARIRPTLLATASAAVLLSGLAGCQIFRSNDDAPTSATAPVATTSDQQAAQDAADEARTLAASGDRAAALAEFERAIAINPELTDAYLGAGDIYRERGDYELAEQRYGEAARIEPQNFDAQYLHGLALQLLDRIDESVRAYLRALTIRPDDFNANLNLASALLQNDEAGQALPYAERAASINPSDGPARVNLGTAYAGMGRHAEAIGQFEAATELMQPTPELLLNLADSYGREARFAEMAGTVRQVIALQPSAEAFERLGSAEFRSRRYQDALAAFTRATQLNAQHYPAHNGIAVCQLNRYVWSERRDTAALDAALAAMRTSLRIEQNQPRILDLLSKYGG